MRPEAKNDGQRRCYLMLALLKKLLLCLCGACFSFAVAAEQSCRLPEHVTPWDYRSGAAINADKDWKSDRTRTDYWRLTLSWSAAFCDAMRRHGSSPAHLRHQCSANRFGLVVHGLWAQSAGRGGQKKHPRNCRDVQAIEARTLKKYLCVIPDSKLIQQQWEKHGTCDFKLPEHYLHLTADLYNRLKLPSIAQLEQLQYRRAAEIRAAFVNLNRGQGMRKEHVWVRMARGRLKEIQVCYDLDYRFSPCR